MWIYLLKFSACLAILLLFYKLVLEKVHFHHFKRYYLLSAFIISLSIPLITFTHYVTVTLEPAQIPTYIEQTRGNLIENKTDIAQILPIILWGIYILGVFIFVLKFLGNLRSLLKNIKNNPKLISGRIHHVLLQELIVPHTFFSYIFFNRKDYETQKIPQEVFWHEETHAQQKHSLDILLLELLQIVLWFHPLVYWAKHLVKLNHEFLADQAVLKKGASVPDYQNMVLAFSSSDSYRNAVAPPLANAIHYSPTRLKLFGKTFVFGPSIFGQVKKRIVIMKSQTSKKAIWLKSLLLIPLITLLLYSFSTKEILEIQELETLTPKPDYQQGIMEQENINESSNQNIPTQEISVSINKYGQLLVNVDLVKLEDLKSHLLKYNQGLTKEQREQRIRAIIRVEKKTPKNIIKKVDAILLDYGVATIDIKGPKKSQNTVGASQREINKFNALAKKYNAQPQETRVIPLKDLKTLETIYSRMNNKQKQQAQPFPECLPPPPPAPVPAKKLEAPKTPTAPLPPSQTSNGETKNQRDPQKKVVRHRLILIKDYNKMYGVYEGLKQKENKTKNEKNTLITLFSHLKKSYANMTVEEKKLVHQPYPPSSPKTSLNKTINGHKESNEKPKIPKELAAPYGNLYTVPQPPPQPNEDPVKYIKELAEKGAIFYMGPHQYKTDEVIELVKKSKDPSIDVSDYPIVRLGGC
ncbi:MULTISPECIES: M56 family metallopeptidase [unclassified Arenibacter]|uniref:M56 family metallopeptidase n=1 Tax=unclassified Arenibacter TaxID=2615047 RepID=UPI000E34972E|nr:MULTISPECIES: M56 family metallopeptidase [unclassified Arenibacter]MCM4162592.1 hypothetical protein [Arenibacter sp. A80]RFT58168.1 hypothetical protein D0S24_03180 [Arenibacter sp. P308M17]